MSYELCGKIENFTPYVPEPDIYKIKMDANESFVTPSEECLSLISKAASDFELARYPDPECLRLCSAFGTAYGVDSKYITAGNGSDELISLICTSFMQKGEKAMVLTPDFSMYKFYLTLAECEVVEYQKNDDFTFDVDDMIRQCNELGCRMLVFSNPCNPTSLGLSRDVVRKIISGVQALVVLDEAYMDFWDQSLINEVFNYDNCIMLRTCSKMLGLAALRVGFAVANEKLTKVLHAVKSPYNVNAFSQAAAASVLEDPYILERAKRKITVSRNELYLLMCDLALSKNIKVAPTCTNFVSVRMDKATDVYEELKKESIIVRNFGSFLRITACKKAQNRALFEVLMRVL